MQDPTNTAAVSSNHIESGHSVKPKKKAGGFDQLGMKVRCPCGNCIPNNSMIKVQLSWWKW